MKKIRNLMIILVILLIIIVAICIIAKGKNYGRSINNPESVGITEGRASKEIANKLVNIEEYLEVKKCVNSYLDELNVNSSRYYGRDESNSYIKLVSEEDINKYMYEVLSEDYINKNSINTNNVRDYVYKIENDYLFEIIELVNKGNTDNVKAFGVYGVIMTQEYEPLMECYIIVNVDENNRTFSVEQLKNKDELNNIEINVPAEIYEKDNNVFSQTGMAYEDLIKEYINHYKRLSLAYPELVYNSFLDDDYKAKRFGSFEEYKEYIDANRNEIIGINPAEYKVSEQGDYTQYIIKDDNSKYYIFNSKIPCDYKVILDTYTIDLPEFTEQYNSATEQQKVAMNIDKFIKAINAKDYKYAYNCLADSFKNNYFKTQEEFENYAKQNFYENNSVEYKEFDTKGEYYTYLVTLTKKDTKEQKNKTFVMKLGEETKFEMSFDR